MAMKMNLAFDIKKIALLYGGMSGEHEVSCVSANFIYQNLLKSGYEVLLLYLTQGGNYFLTKEVRQKKILKHDEEVTLAFGEGLFLKTKTNSIKVDFVFSIIHGSGGEDGRLQGAMEFFNIPFSGSSMISSALSMDKGYMRQIFSQANLPQVSYQVFYQQDFLDNTLKMIETIEKNFSYPIFVKPCNMGSSVGVSKVHHAQQLQQALQEAFAFDFHIIVEQGRPVREIELAILGNYPHYQITKAGEVIPTHDFYSYQAKYIDANGAQLEIPAKISSDEMKQVQAVAVKAFSAVHGDGFARIDLFVDKETHEIYVNEINTLPGFTEISMFPKLWLAEGVSSIELVEKIIALGVEKFLQKEKLTTQYSALK